MAAADPVWVACHDSRACDTDAGAQSRWNDLLSLSFYRTMRAPFGIR